MCPTMHELPWKFGLLLGYRDTLGVDEEVFMGEALLKFWPSRLLEKYEIIKHSMLRCGWGCRETCL